MQPFINKLDLLFGLCCTCVSKCIIEVRNDGERLIIKCRRGVHKNSFIFIWSLEFTTFTETECRGM